MSLRSFLREAERAFFRAPFDDDPTPAPALLVAAVLLVALVAGVLFWMVR